MSTSSQGVLPLPAEARHAIRWVSTNNPFYVVSAGLFLAGLWLSFGDPRKLENTWALMAGLAGYTLLLAATACVLVRYLNLWDDARTVLLLVVLMFLATSVTFDEVLVVEMVDPQGGMPIRGIACYALGFLFAVGVSMTILRGIRLTLPAGFRLPYYLMLGLFFLYPLALSPLLADPTSAALQWGLFGFSSVAGLIFLTLLPAIRRGPRYVRNNGSPWPWPLYPWSLFAFLAAAVPARAVLLCWSLHPIGGGADLRLIFGTYFLVPFGLALAVLLLEMGLRSGNRGLLGGALAAPLFLVGLVLIGHRGDAVYQEFLRIFTSRFRADPLYCTLIASAVFYAYAAIRRVDWAIDCLVATLAVLAFLKPGVLNVPDLGAQPALLMLAAMLILAIGIWQRQSWRCLAGALLLVLSLTLAIPPGGYRWPIAYHLIVLVVFAVGTIFDDPLAELLRWVGPLMVLTACLRVLLLPMAPPPGVPGWLLDVYPAVLAGLVGLYGLLRWHVPSLAITGAIFACWSLVVGWQGYRVCRQLVVGLDYLAMSLLVFGVAIVVSLAKAGVLSRWLSVWRQRGEEAEE